jgi:acyl carrier protein
MTPTEILDELRTILVARLKFDPERAGAVCLDTTLPKGIDGSLGLDSLDFIELGIAIEDRFGIVLDMSEDVTKHFASMETLTRFIAEQSSA